MRFNYGERRPDRLAIAKCVAHEACEMPDNSIVLYQHLLSLNQGREAAMGILATRSGILESLCAAYVLGEDQVFNACASVLLSNAESLARVVDQPCILGVELSLAILLSHTRTSALLAESVLQAPNERFVHPEDAKALVIAMLLTGQRERVHSRLESLTDFGRLSSEERKGWMLWLALALSLEGSDRPSVAKIAAHEERIVRLELSRLDRGKESPLSTFDLVCFNLEALRLLQTRNPCHMLGARSPS